MTAPSVPAGDVAKLVEELRAGLDGVTPGPWQSEQPSWDDETDDADECPRYVASVVATVDDVSAVARLRCDQRADAAHIARCSPDNIAKLLVENARLSRDLADARAAERKAIDELCRWRAAFQSVTPGGSEFMDPNAVKAWADTLKMQVFEANKKAVLAERRARSVLSTQPKETPDVA